MLRLCKLIQYIDWVRIATEVFSVQIFLTYTRLINSVHREKEPVGNCQYILIIVVKFTYFNPHTQMSKLGGRGWREDFQQQEGIRQWEIREKEGRA